jgi:AcrR family transcriptional regulator
VPPLPTPRQTGKQRKRAPGRPSGDAPDLRAHLLDAAIVCFAREGIAATSLRAIAIEASVTPALLHYYFGDKAQLQQAAIEERLMPAFALVRESVQRSSEDVAGLVAGFVCGVAEAVDRHPWLPALWVREILCEGGALREVLLQDVAPQMANMLAQRFAAAQREGRLNPDLDPRLLVTSLIGLTLFPAAGAPIWRRIFDADDIDMGTLRDHAIALLDRGIGVG